MSGDEDVRIGVEIAQGFGVRVHLLGITPSRGSQSKQLLLAADTTTEWSKETVSKFLTVAPDAKLEPVKASESLREVTATIERDVSEHLDQMIGTYMHNLYDVRIVRLYEHFSQNPGVPREHDGPLLARGREILGRDLTSGEKSHLRRAFKEAVRNRVESERR